MKRRMNTSTLLGNLKILWNMKVMFIPIIIGSLGTVTKGLLKELEYLEISGGIVTIQISTLLISASILRRILEN